MGLSIMVMTCYVLGIYELFGVIAFSYHARSIRDEPWVWRYILSITIGFRN